MTLKRILFFITTFLLAVSSEAAHGTSSDLNSLIQDARSFLCAKSFCLTKPVTVVVENSDDYFAFYHAQQNKISLSPTLDAAETQLDLVHEFTHAYRHQFNTNEVAWLDEGLAKLMEYQYGGVWPVSYQERLRHNPRIVLSNDRRVDFSRGGDGYPSSFWLMIYLYNHLGGEKFLKKVLESPFSGWDNIERAARELQASGDISEPVAFLKRDQILFAFSVALFLNDEFAMKYGLFSIDTHYEPLAQAAWNDSNNLAEKEKTTINYFKNFISTDGCETYSVRGHGASAVVSVARSGSAGDAFIQLCF
ncbi:MAG TPA: hypothetical protein VF412_03215 [Bdellovibrio sp.]|uniref:hypothetical protein n=1 Tax=Bdellovibrio sp. TaxID=28201 RepID=UPI002EF0717D